MSRPWHDGAGCRWRKPAHRTSPCRVDFEANTGHDLAMKAVRIADLKDRLSEHLRAVRRGETLTVLDRETPIARIIPYEGNAAALVVRKASMPWDEARRTRPPRLGVRVDSLALLLADRERR